MKPSTRSPSSAGSATPASRSAPSRPSNAASYADIVPLGGSVQPLRGTDSIMWTIKFRNGNMKRFKFPIRTTPKAPSIPTAASRRPISAKIAEPASSFRSTAIVAGDPSELIRK